jgi:hypothetical protein
LGEVLDPDFPPKDAFGVGDWDLGGRDRKAHPRKAALEETLVWLE